MTDPQTAPAAPAASSPEGETVEICRNLGLARA